MDRAMDKAMERATEWLSSGTGGVSDAELHALVIGLQRHEARCAAVRARVTAVWDSRGVWAGDGSKSPAARLGRDCRRSPRSAQAEVRRARGLRAMPATAAALAAGELSVDQVDVLIAAWAPGVAEVFTRDEDLLVAQGRRLSFPDFQRCVAYWRQRADAVGAEERAARQREARGLDVARTLDGMVDVRGLLDPVDGGIVKTELERLEQELFEADWAAARAAHGEGARPEQLARTPRQRRADALVEMARRSARVPVDAHPARPLITVLVGYETFAGRICELGDGTVITPGQVVPWLGEADIERVVFAGPSRVIDVGVRQRFFTGALRRAIEVRDRHCTHPGCTVPADRCHVDHIVEYANGGLTTQANGRLLCPVHNRHRNHQPDSTLATTTGTHPTRAP